MTVEDYGAAAYFVCRAWGVSTDDLSAARPLLATLYLPGVQIDDRGHVVCDHPNRTVAKFLIQAALVYVQSVTKDMNHG